MLQLNLFSFAIEDQISDLKQGEELVFFRGKEKFLIRKHEKYQGVCFYQAEEFSGYALHLDEKSGLDMFVAKINRWLEDQNEIV